MVAHITKTWFDGEKVVTQEIPQSEFFNQQSEAIDANVESVREKLRQRAEIGLAKYGVTTERKDLDLRAWMQHAQEEAMDLAVYLERAMKEIK